MLERFNALLALIGVEKITATDKKNEKKCTLVLKEIAEKVFHMESHTFNKECFCDELVSEVKEKYPTATDENKLKLLSLAPFSWSVSKIRQKFGCSYYMAEKSRQLKQKYGIFPKLELKVSPKKISPELEKKVQDFYRSSTMSREMPGEKDFIIDRSSGTKEKKQKILLLDNLDEIFALFKEQYPDEKVRFHSSMVFVFFVYSVCFCAKITAFLF